MKTVLRKTKNVLPVIFLAIMVMSAFHSVAQPGSGGGNNELSFDNFTLISGLDLQVGAVYRFNDVITNTDALVSIDSLVNGAKVNKIDDNSNGIGYKQAFQPAVQSGNVIGYSYAVFKINFVEKGTSTPKLVQSVNATAIDIDGNNSLKEFARINVGNGGITSYLMNSNPDISVVNTGINEVQGLNIMGSERNGIDTSSLANMFTATNTNISSFTVKYGTLTTVPSSSTRQYSLYMKNFTYPGFTLPVKLASFTATLNNLNNAELKWTTAAEMNVSHFVVERSTDGIHFSDAGIVFAAGNSSSDMNYSFSDKLSGVTATVIWYRLRSVDMDESAEFSATKMIRIGNRNETGLSLTVYPNPVQQDLRVTIPAVWQNKKLVYEMIAVSGQVVNRTQSGNSSQTETLNVRSLAPGMYYVRVTCEGQMIQHKIIKQ